MKRSTDEERPADHITRLDAAQGTSKQKNIHLAASLESQLDRPDNILRNLL